MLLLSFLSSFYSTWTLAHEIGYLHSEWVYPPQLNLSKKTCSKTCSQMCVLGDSQSRQIDNQDQPYKSLSENILSYDLHEDDVIVMINQNY